MTRIILDESLKAKLNGLREPIEFCDETGHIVGHFFPAHDFMGLGRPRDQCPYSDAELAQFQKETGGRSLVEIWQTLAHQ